MGHIISNLPIYPAHSHSKEEFYGKPLILADPAKKVTKSCEMLTRSRCISSRVGDPFGATTHTDVLLCARALGIPTRVIHNASIMNADGACGLQLYNFGQTVSFVFFTDTWRPDSFYDRVRENADSWDAHAHLARYKSQGAERGDPYLACLRSPALCPTSGRRNDEQGA